MIDQPPFDRFVIDQPPSSPRRKPGRATAVALLAYLAVTATACASDHKVTVSDPTARDPVVDSAPSDKFPLPPL